MRSAHGLRIGLLCAFTLLSACRAVPPPVAAAPPPPPAPAPAPSPPRAPAAARPDLAWDVAPVDKGDWSYRRQGGDSLASFGEAATEARFVLICQASTRQLVIRLPLVERSSRAITIRTSSGDLNWQGVASTTGMAMLEASRPARDVGFDWMAYSRGRIGIEMDARNHLVVPVGTEMARVVEDCRN